MGKCIYNIYLVPGFDGDNPVVLVKRVAPLQHFKPMTLLAQCMTERGYALEFFIELPIDDEDFSMKKGETLGFDLVINDADKDIKGGERKSQMVMFGDEDNYKNSSKYARLYLDD